MKNSLCVFIFLLLNKSSFGQDTAIVYHDWTEFQNTIGYMYHDQTNCLKNDLRTQIDSIFTRYDFTGPEYACQYRFSFVLDLDSCGYAVNCTSNVQKENTLPHIAAFSREICRMLLNSNMRIKNTVALSDTSYWMRSAYFQFETSCEPPEILYADDLYSGSTSSHLLLFRDEREETYFSGFRYGCDDH